MANRNYPKNSTATTVIPFDNPVTAIPQKTITGATTFTKSTTGAQAGYCAMIRVVANGSNVPDLSAFKSIGTGTYDNTNGVVNQLWFVYDGTEYCVAITHPGTIVGGGGGGDTTPPSTTSVTVENAEPNKVLIAYGETLDSGSVPATSAYTVKVNGTTRTISGVTISGSSVHVTFGGAAVISTDSITLDYVVPGTSPVQDVAGNDAAALTGVVVGNNVSASFDTESTAYFSAESITSSTEKNAVDTNLVKGLKTDALFTHFKIQYPFLGSLHARNLMNPADTNAAFRISYVGGWTHDAAGSTGNGTNNYGDTHFVPDTNLTLADSTIVIAIGGAASSSDENFIGAYDSTGVTRIARSNATGGNFTADIDGPTGALYYDAAGAAIYVFTRNGTSISMYKNGSLIETKTVAATAKSVSNLYLGALNYVSGGSVIYFASSPIKYAAVVDKGVNATEVGLINTRVQAFLTALGR
jgi:hypothetical protein